MLKQTLALLGLTLSLSVNATSVTIDVSDYNTGDVISSLPDAELSRYSHVPGESSIPLTPVTIQSTRCDTQVTDTCTVKSFGGGNGAPPSC